MADLRIVCTNQVPVSQPVSHAHIVAVGVDTDNDGYADEKHELVTIVKNIRNHIHRYYTKGLITGMIAFVDVIECPVHCRELIIKSSPDAVRDNNLDYLRRCNWK